MPTTESVVVGWGRQNNDVADVKNLTEFGAFSSTMQQLVVPFMAADQCKKFPQFQDLNGDRFICAGGEKGSFKAGYSLTSVVQTTMMTSL